MISSYLCRKHSYGTFDCIQLVKQFYRNELKIELEIPEYPASRRWVSLFTTETFDTLILQYAKKVSLTTAKNYDLLVFKSLTSNYITHFGLYVDMGKMLHVEESSTSQITFLDSYWQERLYGCYRHNSLV